MKMEWLEKPRLLVLDLEGCLVPEIWQAIAQETKISLLKLTTRDVADYDQLMRQRISIVREHQLTFTKICKVIKMLRPLPGALEFLQWSEQRFPTIILSDTFYQFVNPHLMQHLNFPTLFCHQLIIDEKDLIADYKIRISDSKTQVVKNLQASGFHLIAVGDSYNDLGMLQAADNGLFLHSPADINEKFPQFPSFKNYSGLQEHLTLL